MALLPIVLQMTTFFATNVLPIIEQLGNAFASDGEGSFKSKMSAVVEAIKAVVLPAFNGLVAGFNLIRDAIERNSEKLAPFFTLIKNIAGFIVAYLAPAISQTLGVAFKVVGTIISTVIDQFANFLARLTSIFNAIKRIVDFVKGAGSAVGNLFGFNNSSAPSSAPSAPMASRGYSGQAVNYNNNITVNGAIDSESTARQIVDVLNQSSYRGTLGAGAFA
jgi:phage-related protein